MTSFALAPLGASLPANTQAPTVHLPPFGPADELVVNSNELDDVDQHASVPDLLQALLATPLLDHLYGVLWLVAKQAGDHIDPLHVHAIKRRTIRITEDPKLHLVWHYDIVFIKPLPNCLLNHQFWTAHLLPRQCAATSQALNTFALSNISPLTRQALGFLRSYGLIIRHCSDLRMAQDAHLLPQDLTFAEFNRFISPFRSLQDEAVSPRYQYGQLRLTRLNWACRLATPFLADQQFLWNYQERFWQTQQFLDRLGAPLLFVFATVSLLLSAMQVALGAWGSDTPKAFSTASRIFSVGWIIITALLFDLLIVGVASLLLLQLCFAFRMRQRIFEARLTAARP